MFTPLVSLKEQKYFNMNPVVTDSTNTTKDTNTTNPSAETSNNATATFRDINTSSKIDNSDKQNQQLAEAMANATKNKDSGSTNDTEQKALSDERCKELFGSGDLLSAIADLNAYVYKYKEGAEKIDPDATPDEKRVGILAQELQANPATSAAVETDPSGFLKVNTKELSLTEMAVIAELCKRVEAIETYLRKQK